MKLLSNGIEFVYSKKHLLTVFLLFFTLVACTQQPKQVKNSNTREVVKGNRALKSEAKKYGSIVALLMDGKSLCTGTYLGNGFIITALHCVASHKLTDTDKPVFTIKAPNEFRSTRESKMDEVEVFIAPSEREILVKGVKTSVDDVALLKFSGEFGKELEKLTPATVTTNEIKKGETGFYVGGYGFDQFDKSVAAIGLLNIGKADFKETAVLTGEELKTMTEEEIAELDSVTQTVTLSDYDEKSGFSAILKGDSGGPLFKLVDDKVVVYGIASMALFSEDEVATTGKAKNAKNLHSRVDYAGIREWIECITSAK